MQLPTKYVYQVIDKSSEEYGNRRSESRGGRIITSGTPGHRYSFTLITPPLSQRETLELDSFRELIGHNGVFTARLPIFSDSVVGGAPVVRDNTSAGTNIVPCTGFNPNEQDAILPGMMLTFANHSKAYTIAVKETSGIIDDYNSQVNTDLTLKLTKPLLSDVVAGEALDFQPLFTLIADTDQWAINIDAKKGKFQSIELPCTEYF